MQKPVKPVPDEREFYDLEHIASATECTGLIPAAYDDGDSEPTLTDRIKRHK